MVLTTKSVNQQGQGATVVAGDGASTAGGSSRREAQTNITRTVEELERRNRPIFGCLFSVPFLLGWLPMRGRSFTLFRRADFHALKDKVNNLPFSSLSLSRHELNEFGVRQQAQVRGKGKSSHSARTSKPQMGRQAREIWRGEELGRFQYTHRENGKLRGAL